MSATGLLIMCLVIVVSLAVGIAAVLLADRSPYSRRPHAEARRGRVQGGTHVGGGRSVAPRRDARVIPGENPDDSTVPGRPGRPGSGSG
jgi:hypothetical protein